MTKTNEASSDVGMTVMQRLVGRIALGLTEGAAWVVSKFRPLQVYYVDHGGHEVGPHEGLPVPAVYCSPVKGMPWWRLDAWREADCWNLDAFGWHGEVHFETKLTAAAVA